jgi:hydroxypyruvate isomerase
MKRRDFIKSGAAAGAAALANSIYAGGAMAESGQTSKFKLKYAPHFGMFRNHAPGGPIDELKFMADQGFTALEDNGMKGRSISEQEQIAKEMQRLGMTMGVFVANSITWDKPTLASGRAEFRDLFLKDITDSVDVAKRVNAKWMTVVPGFVDLRQEMDYQAAHVVESLKRASAILEPHNLVMVLEPLNWWRDHPGLFLSKIPQAYLICKAVASPSCKILFDMYHQQITEGNIIPNIDKAWDETPYFQIGDNPGRKEPTTGEMNYKNIFKHIHGKGFTGVLGMEHGNSKPGKEGELALIAAYREVDSF